MCRLFLAEVNSVSCTLLVLPSGFLEPLGDAGNVRNLLLAELPRGSELRPQGENGAFRSLLNPKCVRGCLGGGVGRHSFSRQRCGKVSRVRRRVASDPPLKAIDRRVHKVRAVDVSDKPWFFWSRWDSVRHI